MKKEEFKKFVSNHPTLVNVVSKKKYTWQELYEVYDLYGDDMNVWNKYLNNSSSDGISSASELVNLFKGINVDSLRKYIDTAQKAISIVSDLTGSKNSVNISPNEVKDVTSIFED